MAAVPVVLRRLKQELKSLKRNREKQLSGHIAGKLLTHIKHRLGHILKLPNPALYAAALHPAYGHLSFLAPAVRDAVWLGLEDEGLGLLKQLQAGVAATSLPSINPAPAFTAAL